MDLTEFLNAFDFTYEISKDTENNKVYRLVDKQHANLGNIENEDFYNIGQIVARLDIYYHDYIYKDICEVSGHSGFEDYEAILDWLEKDKNTYCKYLLELVGCIVFPDNITEQE